MISTTISDSLALSLKNGFISCDTQSLERYNPKLLINDSKREIKVLSSIQNELRTCSEFYFSVAFITEGGLQSLLNTFDELSEENIKGRILTSSYQNFTQPKALRRLLKYPNIELRIVTEENFHAKGYIFKHVSEDSESFSFIIGSSNLTQNALSYNKEWNLKLTSLENGAVMQNILHEFNYAFDNALIVTPEWIDEYEKIYSPVRTQIRNSTKELIASNTIQLKPIAPNKMQIAAKRQLQALRNSGKDKALLISATGTGKTYLSAFDVQEFNPERMLFVVHRENILRAAETSYKRVLGANIDSGILSGSRPKDFTHKYTFATLQTLSRDDYLNQFAPDAFDYIVIDEAHRSGAESYRKILNHFKPKFLLGMTATPERTDGYDIFKQFDYNIAFEIRLHDALAENMLSPFHYFGVTDITVDGELLDDNAEFSKLVCNERVDRIIEASEHYGYNGDRLRGLIFCSRKAEAEELSTKLNERGYKTVALTGDASEDFRELCIKKLEQEDRNTGYDYLITVDIFNEGIDIPTVNQIIMLRPTQSAIIFVQQLGRGLRKVYGKEYLTVIDFIGNYSNNYLVPIALYGDRSYNKDTIRKLINSESAIIPGCSTVNFDRITKERIFQAINKANLSLRKDLKKDYELLKYRLGRRPMMVDFLEQGAREPYAFVEYSGSYYSFLRSIDSDGLRAMSIEDENLLKFYSLEVLNAKRPEDGILLALLMAKGSISKVEFEETLRTRFNHHISEKEYKSIVNLLNGDFLKQADEKKYGIEANIRISGNTIVMDEAYRSRLIKEPLHTYLIDMLRYDYKKSKAVFSDEKFHDGFQLYEKYSRKDVCRILCWAKNEESTMYGYRIKYNTCPIFVTYNKSDDISDTTKYADQFVDTSHFSWMTRSRVTLDSREVQELKAYAKTGMRIPLFIKKEDGEGSDFYFVGDVIPEEFEQTIIAGKPVVEILYRLSDEVPENLYNYFNS